jgi:hypothetical protein
MRKAADTKTTAAIKYVEMALEKFKKDHGYYPQTGGTAVLMFEKDPARNADSLIGRDHHSLYRSHE